MPSTLTCADCGKQMVKVKASRPQGEARCQPCRSGTPRSYRMFERICPWCDQPFLAKQRRAKYCTIRCANKHKGLAQMVRSEHDSYVRRGRRESAAPGLSYSKRKRLLRTWMRQQRACAYCPDKATTIDHVVPLVRGGTNYEGNLTPCCKPCNSSKGGLTLVEWRTGLRLPRMTTPLVHQPRVRVAKVKPPKPTHPCPLCGTETSRRMYCSHACTLEVNSRKARDRYRARVGVPFDPNEPVRSPRTRDPIVLGGEMTDYRARFHFRSEPTPTPSREVRCGV